MLVRAVLEQRGQETKECGDDWHWVNDAVRNCRAASDSRGPPNHHMGPMSERRHEQGSGPEHGPERGPFRGGQDCRGPPDRRGPHPDFPDDFSRPDDFHPDKRFGHRLRSSVKGMAGAQPGAPQGRGKAADLEMSASPGTPTTHAFEGAEKKASDEEPRRDTRAVLPPEEGMVFLVLKTLGQRRILMLLMKQPEEEISEAEVGVPPEPLSLRIRRHRKELLCPGQSSVWRALGPGFGLHVHSDGPSWGSSASTPTAPPGDGLRVDSEGTKRGRAPLAVQDGRHRCPLVLCSGLMSVRSTGRSRF
ncbi:hypothetical protein CB1_001533085 [Camelus ferus]|nr:hypothetical protein CB1_001533085 [Camelus ferus]